MGSWFIWNIFLRVFKFLLLEVVLGLFKFIGYLIWAVLFIFNMNKCDIGFVLMRNLGCWYRSSIFGCFHLMNFFLTGLVGVFSVIGYIIGFLELFFWIMGFLFSLFTMSFLSFFFKIGFKLFNVLIIFLFSFTSGGFFF